MELTEPKRLKIIHHKICQSSLGRGWENWILSLQFDINLGILTTASLHTSVEDTLKIYFL